MNIPRHAPSIFSQIKWTVVFMNKIFYHLPSNYVFYINETLSNVSNSAYSIDKLESWSES